MLQAGGVTDKGRVRPNNEDRFAVDESLQLCVIADGMGGHQAGEIAAHLAVDAVLDVIRERQTIGWPYGFDPSLSETGNLLRTAIQLANMHVFQTAGSSNGYAGMGTTIVAAIVTNGRLTVGHVGDSRLYCLSGERLCQLTQDDSWLVAVLAKDPAADPAMLREHPMRHALTNVVGARLKVDVHIAEQELRSGDLLLLTTDGVHGAVDDRTLEQLLLGVGDVSAAASDLVSTAIMRGSRDNCTAVVARWQG